MSLYQGWYSFVFSTAVQHSVNSPYWSTRPVTVGPATEEGAYFMAAVVKGWLPEEIGIFFQSLWLPL